jgi:hypothetical protein
MLDCKVRAKGMRNELDDVRYPRPLFNVSCVPPLPSSHQYCFGSPRSLQKLVGSLVARNMDESKAMQYKPYKFVGFHSNIAGWSIDTVVYFHSTGSYIDCRLQLDRGPGTMSTYDVSPIYSFTRRRIFTMACSPV